MFNSVFGILTGCIGLTAIGIGVYLFLFAKEKND
jgi:hypothetical protein